MDVKVVAVLSILVAVAIVAPAAADGPSPTELANSAMTRSTRASRRVARMLDMARRTGDVRQAMCLDDALNRIDSQVRLVEDRAERIRRAEAEHDDVTVAREARLIANVLHLLPQTEHLADACVGIVVAPNDGEQTSVEMEAPATTWPATSLDDSPR